MLKDLKRAAPHEQPVCTAKTIWRAIPWAALWGYAASVTLACFAVPVGQFDDAVHWYTSSSYSRAGFSNPGRASLQAALHPAQTDYLYFVSDNQGHHRFARTDAEHASNVQAYRRAVQAANR